MKKLLLTFLGTLAIFSFVACNNPQDLSNEEPTNNQSTEKSGKTSETPGASGNGGTGGSFSGGTASTGMNTNIRQLPVIKIQTTNPNNLENPLEFVTQPVSDTVKQHAHSYFCYDYDSAPKPWYEDCSVTVTDENGINTLEDVTTKVKARGNYTTTYPKKGIKLKFEQKQTMLGLHKEESYKEWVLLACWKDFSMLRDYTAYRLFELINPNYYVTDCKLVEVYINNEYWGVYLLAEQQESKRVGISDEGYLLEYDGYGQYIEDKMGSDNELIEQDFVILDEYGSFTDLNGEVATGFNQYYTIKSKYDDSKKTFIKDYMDKLWIICREAIQNGIFLEFNSDYSELVSSSATSAKECISKVVDIDSLVATFIQQEIACDLDLNWSSFYMDLDLATDKKLTFEAPWDFDSSFGNHKDRELGNDNKQISHLFSVTTTEPCHGNPWTVLFAKESWFQDAVRAKWADMNSRRVKEIVIAEINAISNSQVYKDAFARNYTKWQNIGKPVGDELSSATVSCQTQREAANAVINFLNQRFNMLNSDFQTFKSSNPSLYSTKNSITCNGSAADISYSIKISVEAKEDGLHIKTDYNDTIWNHTDLWVKNETTGQKLPYLKDLKNATELVYELVKSDNIYSVWIIQQHEDNSGNWKGWHSTEFGNKVIVKSIGGKGEAYINYNSLDFNSTDKTIKLNNMQPIMPLDLNYSDISYEITLFDGKPWEAGVNTNYNAEWKFEGTTIVINDKDNFWNGKTLFGAVVDIILNINPNLPRPYCFEIFNGLL